MRSGTAARETNAVTDPVLYNFRRCPYAMRARLALLASGTQCELREVRLSAKPDAMLEASLKGTVPVLVLPDGSVIEESLEIMEWALARNDPSGWLERRDASLIEENDGPFKHALDRYKYPDRHGTDAREHRASGQQFLRVLEVRLSDHAQLSGETMGFTDAAIMPFVRQFAATDRAWFDAQPLPRLKAWLSQHLESALFAACMMRPAVWQPGDDPVRFPAET